MCPVHAVTGWWCPLCGLTRATVQLLTGHPLEAARYNALLVVVPVLVWALAGRRRHVPATVAVVLVVFGVVRNVPAAGWLRGP